MRLSIVLALLTCACGTSATRRPAAPAPSAAMRAYPVLGLVPEGVSYALLASRTGDALTAAHELLAAFALVGDFDAAEAEQELAGELGFDPFSPAGAQRAGIALDRSAAVFGELFPVILLPIADRSALDGFLEARRPSSRVSVRQYRGSEWLTWYPDGEDRGGVVLHWLAVGDYLAVHPGLARDARDTGWVDGLLGDGPRLGEHPDMARALEVSRARLQASAPVELVGLLRAERVIAALQRLMPAGVGAKLEPCWTMSALLAAPVVAGVDLEPGAARGVIVADLAPDVAAGLGRHIGSPPPGFGALVARAGFYAGMGLELGWLDERRTSAGCPLLGEELLPPMLPAGFAGLFVAVESLNLEDLSGRGALHANLRDRRWVEALLDNIPQRGLFERSAKVAGQAVKEISIPLMFSLTYLLTDTGVTASMGKGVMAEVLGGSAQPGPAELAALYISPARLPNLRAILEAIADMGIASKQLAASAAERLSGYDHGSVRLDLDGHSLILGAGMQRAR